MLIMKKYFTKKEEKKSMMKTEVMVTMTMEDYKKLGTLIKRVNMDDGYKVDGEKCGISSYSILFDRPADYDSNLKESNYFVGMFN